MAAKQQKSDVRCSSHPRCFVRGRFVRKWFTFSTVLSLVFIALALLSPLHAHMQDGADPALRITRLDLARFPEMQVQVYGANLGKALADVPLTLSEDGVPQTITRREQVKAGTQTALVLDAAGDIGRPGQTGEPRFIEVGLAARRLVELQLLSPESDRLTAISFGPDKKLSVLKPWSGDHQAVVDSLYIYEPVAGIGFTPLSDLILYAVAQFDDSSLAPGQEKSIVVFSDGIDAVGNTELIDAITEAKNRDIRIHAVLVGPATPAAQRNMSRLAAMTNGKYLAMSSIESLDDLWRSIADSSSQELLTYRTSKPAPRQVEVAAKSADGQTLTASAAAPAANLQPVQVNILAPMPNQLYERQGGAYDTAIGDLEPRTIDVQTAFTFPDNLPRAIRRVEYQVGNLSPVVRTEPPFDQPYTLPVDTLTTGAYGLRVRAVDELGVVGESEPLPLRISEVRPAAPAPTPDAALIAQVEQSKEAAAQAQAKAIAASQEVSRTAAAANEMETRLAAASEMMQRLSWVTIASAALAVIALGVAIYVLSSKDRRRRATEVITGTVKAVTEPFARASHKGGGPAVSRTKLTLVDGAGSTTVPAAIPLYGGSLRIGRDPNLVNVVIDDRRISRLHCRIMEEGGHYKVLDEGSTSGTYVNETEVSISGQQLQPGDMLSIGPINYRFDADSAAPKTVNGTFENEKLYDHTEPYVKTPGR